MDPVILSDDIAADSNKKILADTSWEEFGSIHMINFRILKIFLSTGGKRPQGFITDLKSGRKLPLEVLDLRFNTLPAFWSR